MNRTPYGRHFCSECNGRVFPGDTFETLTEAPGMGTRGAPILLSSENSKRRTKGLALMAWCWNRKAHGSSGKWVETYRKDKYDLEVEYMKRLGVTFHFAGQTGAVAAKISERRFARVLDQRLEVMRTGAGIIQSRPRLRVVKNRRKSA